MLLAVKKINGRLGPKVGKFMLRRIAIIKGYTGIVTKIAIFNRLRLLVNK